MQTFGTVLKLAGSIITFGGLLYAWHQVSGRLHQWHDAMSGRASRLRESVAKWLPQRDPQAPIKRSFTLNLEPQFTMEAKPVQGGTAEERLARLEGEIYTLNHQFTQMTSTLRVEIDDARAAMLEESKTLSDAIRLRDLCPALVGILVSIVGYAVQLYPLLSIG
jgi:hypothetical protein